MFLWQIFEYFRNWYYGKKADEKTAPAASSCPMSASKSAKVEEGESKEETKPDSVKEKIVGADKAVAAK